MTVAVWRLAITAQQSSLAVTVGRQTKYILFNLLFIELDADIICDKSYFLL